MKIESFVISMENRKERLARFREENKNKTKRKINTFNAINGYELDCTNELLKLFEDNDFGMRAGVVGCALSHLQLYIDLAYSKYDAFLIFEDDAILLDDFDKKLEHALKNTDHFDLMYLGHHPRNENTMSKNLKHFLPKTKVKNSRESFANSIGGLFGYIITKEAVHKILNTINEHGLQCAIDTFIQYMSNTLICVYCSPFLVYSLCYRPGKDVDSDIQYSYTPVKNINDHYIFCSVYHKIQRIKEGNEFTLRKMHQVHSNVKNPQ